MWSTFQKSYYEVEKRHSLLNPTKFLKQAPIIVIDNSKQNDSATALSVDVRIKLESSDNFTGVTAYCLLIHDRIIEYSPLTREVRKLV